MLHWTEGNVAGRSWPLLAFSWLGMAFVAWFSVHFARERLYADAAYFLIQVVKEGDLHVINGRWIIALIQWLPVVGVRLEVPMSTLITLASLANGVVMLACYLYLTLRLKDPKAGAFVVATQLVGVAHALFCPVFEFYYGAMLLVVFWSIVYTDRTSRWERHILLSVLFILIISSHFMALLVMLLTLAMERIWQRPRLMVWLVVLGALHLWQRLTFLTEYEAGAFGSVFTRLHDLGLLWTFSPGRLGAVFLHAVFHYPDTLVLATIATIVLVRSRDAYGLFVYLGGLASIYVLTSLFLPDATQSYYREIVDYPPTVWVLFVVVSRGMAHRTWRPVVLGALLCVLTFRLAYTVKVAEAYTARVHWMEQRITDAREHGIRRGLVTELPSMVPFGRQVTTLPPLSPMETLLLSARQGPDALVVLVPMPSREIPPDITRILDARMAEYGVEFTTGKVRPYFHMPSDEYVVLP